MFRIEPMTQDDVPEVSRVERRCFTNPWPTSAYRRELRAPQQNYYIVLRSWPDEVLPEPAPNGHDGTNGHGLETGPARGDVLRVLPRLPLRPFGRRPESAAQPTIAGFAGMWIMYDEAHITTIGIDPAYRGRGLGERLLVALFDEARRRGAAIVTLEVRVSNTTAQNLYRKYGFTVQGRRKRYYSDNDEDAYIMWSRSLRDDAYLEHVAALRAALVDRVTTSSQPSAVSRQPTAEPGSVRDKAG